MRDRDWTIDRRRSHRHSLRIPLRLEIWGNGRSSRSGKSIDISEAGALLETDLALLVGSLLDMRMTLPEEITGQPTTEWRCKGRVVRIAPSLLRGYPLQVAVQFDSLDVSRM